MIIKINKKPFNDSLKELKNHFNFNLQVVDNFKDNKNLKNYKGLIIHEDALINENLSNKVNLFYGKYKIKDYVKKFLLDHKRKD